MKLPDRAMPFVFLIVVLATWWHVGWIYPQKIAERLAANPKEGQAAAGQWGDQFGAVNSLLSSFTLILAFYGIYSQWRQRLLDEQARRLEMMELSLHRQQSDRHEARSQELATVNVRIAALTALCNSVTARLEYGTTHGFKSGETPSDYRVQIEGFQTELQSCFAEIDRIVGQPKPGRSD